MGVQEGSLGDVTGDFEALDNASTACPVLGRGAGVIELFWARAGSKVLAVGHTRSLFYSTVLEWFRKGWAPTK